jgi:hypothetical protein
MSNKNTTPKNQQTESRISIPKPARKTSPARKTCRIPGNKTAPKPDPDDPRRSQEAPPPETVTVVEARIDVGLGNTLFIRGQGDGLSWERGKPLTCVDASTWVWVSSQARDKVVFKLLLNDQIWAQGKDLFLEAGRKIEIVPSF